MKRTAVALVLVAPVSLSGCSSPHSPSPIAHVQPDLRQPLATKQICQQVLGPAVLLQWAPGTVAEFRAYQYSGPKPIVPLAHAFPGLPGSTHGAWCGTKGGRQITHWSAAVAGHKAASVITIHGPGEGVRRGSVPGPPRVP